METLLIALGAGVAFIVAYHTYGRWLGSKIFNLSADFVCPSKRLEDGKDYVPTRKSVVFGHHFTSIAGTGPIVGPAIAIMWGWLPALLWVVFGSIFIGAVHDFGALVISLRNNGQTVGDISGRLLNRRVRLLFLFVLFMALTVVLAIFGLVIAAVFKMYPAAIFPCIIQIPIAVAIGVWLHSKGKDLLIPSILALAVMYITVVFGNSSFVYSAGGETYMVGLGVLNAWMAGWPIIYWVVVLLVYSYVASVLPVWTLLQPRDYINSLQLISALGLIVIGLVAAALFGGAPPVVGAERPALEIVAPLAMWKPDPTAPIIFPFLFITIACGAISGFHCLVSSGTSSKQLEHEPDARFVGFGSMLTEGFLATLVILACVAGLGMGLPIGKAGSPNGTFRTADGVEYEISQETTDGGNGEVLVKRIEADNAPGNYETLTGTAIRQNKELGIMIGKDSDGKDLAVVYGASAWKTRYSSWASAEGLGAKVGAFVDGAANFLKAIGIPGGIAIALMGVLVASFAGTTLDTACRLQRYVIQELAATFVPSVSPTACGACGYDLSFNVSGDCPECGSPIDHGSSRAAHRGVTGNPLTWLTNKHAATIFGVLIAGAIAALPKPGVALTLKTSGTGGLILWPLFGATNQLLAGLSFLVITFYLWRRKKPIWFVAIPLVFMLIMPAVAMVMQLPVWIAAENRNWTVIIIAIATLILEAWMIVEAVILMPRIKGVLEAALPELPGEAAAAGAVPGSGSGPDSGMNC